MEKDTKILFSGMQATGSLTLGNYLGALKNWVGLQDQYKCYYCVVDLHSLTVRQDPKELRNNVFVLYALYMAAGLDPKRSVMYFQSHVSGHAELGWLLDCFTYMGELNRMTQFKDKSAKHADNINAGLYTYPVLMASDILLFQSDLVPVGVDQRQHLELTRDIAIRFNNIFGDVFTVPEGYYGKNGAKVMSLADPTKKMSKSDENKNATILLLDDKDTIIKKFKKAVTDSEACVRYSEEKPGVSNLMEIYGAVTGKTHEEIEKEFEGKGYGDFKMAVGEAVADELSPLQKEYERIFSDKAFLNNCIKENAKIAEAASKKTLDRVKDVLGLTVL